MNDKIEQIVEYMSNSHATLFAGVALIFGAIRIVLVPSERTMQKFFTTFFICIPFGTIAGGLCYEQFGQKVWLSMAVASTASFLAEKLLMAAYNADWWTLFKEWFERKTSK